MRGFTLVELMIVVAIVGIIAIGIWWAVDPPQYDCCPCDGCCPCEGF